MCHLSVSRRVLEVGNHDAQLALPFLGYIDIVPDSIEVCAAGDLLNLLECVVDLLYGSVTCVQQGALRNCIAERVEIDIDVELLGQIDAGHDGVSVVLFRNGPRRVDIDMDVRQVLRADGLALLIEIVRVTPVWLLECDFDRLERVL